MDKIKIEYIETLLQKRSNLLGSPYNLIIHSILNSIDLIELIYFYLPLSDSELKKSIESNIYKRVSSTVNAESLYDRLYKNLQKTNYNQRQRIRKILRDLLPSLDNLYRRDFFNFFYYSEYSNDKSSALKICGEIWDDDLSTLILNDYLKTKKEIYLTVFLDYGMIERLLPHLEKIWEQKPSDYLKKKIIKLLCIDHIDQFEFLRQIEPENYLWAISMSDKEFNDEILLDCLNDIREEFKPLGILSLSRMNKWNLIENEIKKYVC